MERSLDSPVPSITHENELCEVRNFGHNAKRGLFRRALKLFPFSKGRDSISQARAASVWQKDADADSEVQTTRCGSFFQRQRRRELPVVQPVALKDEEDKYLVCASTVFHEEVPQSSNLPSQKLKLVESIQQQPTSERADQEQRAQWSSADTVGSNTGSQVSEAGSDQNQSQTPVASGDPLPEQFNQDHLVLSNPVPMQVKLSEYPIENRHVDRIPLPPPQIPNGRDNEVAVRAGAYTKKGNLAGLLETEGIQREDENLVVGKFIPPKTEMIVILSKEGMQAPDETILGISGGRQGVITEVSRDGLCKVRWGSDASEHWYRTGKLSRFELSCVPQPGHQVSQQHQAMIFSHTALGGLDFEGPSELPPCVPSAAGPTDHGDRDRSPSMPPPLAAGSLKHSNLRDSDVQPQREGGGQQSRDDPSPTLSRMRSNEERSAKKPDRSNPPEPNLAAPVAAMHPKQMKSAPRSPRHRETCSQDERRSVLSGQLPPRHRLPPSLLANAPTAATSPRGQVFDRIPMYSRTSNSNIGYGHSSPIARSVVSASSVRSQTRFGDGPSVRRNGPGAIASGFVPDVPSKTEKQAGRSGWEWPAEFDRNVKGTRTISDLNLRALISQEIPASMLEFGEERERSHFASHHGRRKASPRFHATPSPWDGAADWASVTSVVEIADGWMGNLAEVDESEQSMSDEDLPSTLGHTSRLRRLFQRDQVGDFVSQTTTPSKHYNLSLQSSPSHTSDRDHWTFI